MITLENGGIQSAANIFVPNGSISFSLNVDATVIASPFGFVCADIPVVFQFDSNGNILPNSPAAAAQIWSNAELNPQNDIGLGTYYLVTLYDQNGARLNSVPMWWQFTEANGATVNISEMTPFATIGGNVIFYPTSLTIPPPTALTLGGVYANAGAAHEWISAINTDGTVTLSQPSFSDISGTISAGQLPSPLTFGATTFSGLITGSANITLGVIGTTSGQITLDGSTSGSCTITAPAVAGTSTNPIAFSNSLNIPSGTVYAINGDTGISRGSAGVLDVGNGTAGNASGTVNAAGYEIAGSPLVSLVTVSAGTGVTTAGAISVGYSGTASPFLGDGTNARIMPIVLYKGYSFAATGNITSAGTVLGSATGAHGSLTLVANQQVVGSVIHVKASGTILVSTTSMNITFKILLNGGVCSSDVATSVTDTSACLWEYEAWIYCSAVGAASTATMKTTANLKIYAANGTSLVSNVPAVTSLGSTVATTGTQALDLQMLFGTSETSNTCTCLFFEATLE